MKSYFNKALALFFVAAAIVLQQGCVKDKCKKTYTYTYYMPLYKTSAEVRANIKSNVPKEIVTPGKIYIKGNYIFLNEVNKGIHVIDNSNPATPKNIAFIDLPGNVDIAIKGDILYADFYTDLVVLNIADPLKVTVAKFVSNVFPERFYYGYGVDSSKIIYDWVKKEETTECNCNDGNIVYQTYSNGVLASAMDLSANTSSNGSPVGISGSLARFTLINDYMYTVSTNALKVIDVSNATNPFLANTIGMSGGIETIFPFKDKLFIGSNTGMFIYSVQQPASPTPLGAFQHVRTCDPVIADNDFAYVTLHSGTACGGFTNQLDVLNISNLQSPQLVKSYLLTSPKGLSKDGNLLFICDGDSVKVFDATNPAAITAIKQFGTPKANDVIAFNNIALVVAKDGLYQYDYTNALDIKLISKIAIQN